MKTRRTLKPEPLWYLKALAHSAYLQTDHWRLRRDAFLQTRGDNLRCDFCGLDTIDTIEVEISRYVDLYGNECSSRNRFARPIVQHGLVNREPKFHVHHLNYDHIGEELDSDLELLCAPCHNLKHFPHSAAAHHWANLRGIVFQAEIPNERPDPLTRGFLSNRDVPNRGG